jgi:hypothetical protein
LAPRFPNLNAEDRTMRSRRWICAIIALAGAVCVIPRSHAYIEAPMSFGAVIAQSSNIVLMRVESVDREKNLIIYRKVKDIKGVHPQELIKHNIGRGGLRPNEWKPQMDWAEPGRMACFFHNGGASETCIGTWWYQAYGGGDWWNHSHAEPFLLRSYAGPPEKLVALIGQVLEGKEVVVPCMVDGNKEDLHNRKAKIQRLKVSLKLQDYNPKRDFVGWGGEDFRRIGGMPGFTHISALPRVDPEAQAISAADYDGDGKTDLCLVGGGRVVLMQNNGDSLSENFLPGIPGARAAVWADYNGDARPDLLLATPGGPRLFTNLGGGFRDDSHLLPAAPPTSVTAAAWLDHDADGKPDLLLAHGYQGLRLYRNVGLQAPPAPAAPKFGAWHYLGPLDNTGMRGFDTPHPCETKLDLKAVYEGKDKEKIAWKEAKFADGAVNNLALFKPQHNVNAAVYLYRTIEVASAMELPISLGSDDTLTVWLNGQKVLANNVYRAAAPDQDRVNLQLKAGKNDLLLKVCQGEGEWAFYFQAEKALAPVPKGIAFVDVSTGAGLGPDGAAAGAKSDALTVSDLDGDGRVDFIYGSQLFLNRKDGKGTTFAEVRDAGLKFTPGRISPMLGDFNGDGHPDLFVAQKGACLLFQNDGRGRFVDVTAKAGDLRQPLGWATSAAAGDFDNDGKLDIVVGCLKTGNRFFRNNGDGTFADATDKLGLEQKIFNTQAVSLLDLNGDGGLDAIFNNEGQDSVVLLGNPPAGQCVPLTLQVAGKEGVIGSRATVKSKDGKLIAVHEISGGDGRGGQQAPIARFTLTPGPYKVEVRYSTGVVRGRDITVGDVPQRGVVDDKTE